MAHVSKDRNGSLRLRFNIDPQTQRGFRIGKVSSKVAQRLCDHVDELVSSLKTGQPVSPATAEATSRLLPAFRAKFERAGLLEPQKPQMGLAAFLTAYIDSRGDLKPSTRDNLTQAKVALIEYFGAERELGDITPGDADEFRLWLQTKRRRPLAANTAKRLCSRAKQFFLHAQRKRLVKESPFADMRRLAVTGNESRRRFIDRPTIDRVLAACPSVDWRLIVVLCRFGGMRPSEACNLRWEHVSFERRRIRIRCEKTEHTEGREWREIPFFPEIVPHLQEAWDAAPEGAEMVIQKYRATQNLRMPFQDIVARAGVEVWGKPFQNLRATRETELVREFPLHVVCSWLGNTAAVAKAHYLSVTDTDFEKAAGGGGADGGQAAAARQAG